MSFAGNRFDSLNELMAGDAVYAFARGWWRPARVVGIGRRRVTVAFHRIGQLGRVGVQTVVLTRLRRSRGSDLPEHRCVDGGEPPSLAEIERARERGLLR